MPACLLAACRSQDGASADSAAQGATSTIAPAESKTPTESPAPTSTPDFFEGIVLPGGTGTLHRDGDQWIFDSPLTVEIGKNVPVAITDQINVDGQTQTWLGLKDHPDWPLFIQNQDGSWRGAMKYVKVTERFNFEDYDQIYFLKAPSDSFVISGARAHGGCYGNDVSYYLYQLFPVIAGMPYQDEAGNWIGIFAVPLDNRAESPMVIFDVILRPGIADPSGFILTQNIPKDIDIGAGEGFAPASVASGHDYDLEKTLANNIGVQIGLEGIDSFLTDVPMAADLANCSLASKVIAQAVEENFQQTGDVLDSLVDKRFVEANNTGLYVWGLNTVFMNLDY